MTTRYRRLVLALLMIISTAFLPAADVECRDDKIKWNWPTIYVDDECWDCGGDWYYDDWYYDDCYGWWCW